MAIEVRLNELGASLKEILKLYYDMFVAVHDVNQDVVDKAVESMGEVSYSKMAACMKYLLLSFEKYSRREVKE